jgi:hypothetical protein
MGKLAVPDICMGVVLFFAVFGMERSVVLMDLMDVGAAMRWTVSVVNLVIILFQFSIFSCIAIPSDCCFISNCTGNRSSCSLCSMHWR